MNSSRYLFVLDVGSRARMLAVSQVPARPPYFGADFVDRHRQRYGKRVPEQRPLTFDIAVEDDYLAWREWLDYQLAQLDAPTADMLASRLWLDDKFWSVVVELAVGALLRESSLRVEYEREWDGLRPDWTVLAGDGTPQCFVEVHTDNPPREAYGQIGAWQGLVARIREIPVPVVLTVSSDGRPVRPPDPRTAKRIAQDLRHQLLRPRSGSYLVRAQGYSFLVESASMHRLASGAPRALAARLLPPSSIAGEVSGRRLTQRIEQKAHKYAGLAGSHNASLVVAVGAHRFTGLGLEQLDALLQGSSTMTFQFNAGDPFIGEATLANGDAEPWAIPATLAGVLWVDNEFPFNSTWRSNPAAARPMFWPPTET